MSLWNPFRRKQVVDTEAARRERLLQFGRIADGLIIDIGAADTEDSGVIYYTYESNGVDYQSSQKLNDEQQQRPLAYAPGASITVRYDPHQPANSVVV